MHINGARLDFAGCFGGFKQSGNGREWGEAGLNEFLELKAIFGLRHAWELTLFPCLILAGRPSWPLLPEIIVKRRGVHRGSTFKTSQVIILSHFRRSRPAAETMVRDSIVYKMFNQSWRDHAGGVAKPAAESRRSIKVTGSLGHSDRYGVCPAGHK